MIGELQFAIISVTRAPERLKSVGRAQHPFHSENSMQVARACCPTHHFSACSLPALVPMERMSL